MHLRHEFPIKVMTLHNLTSGLTMTNQERRMAKPSPYKAEAMAWRTSVHHTPNKKMKNATFHK